MRYGAYLLFTFALFCSGCSLQRLQRQGQVASLEFFEVISFDTVKSVIILPVRLDGEEKQFLFDTGAEFTVLQRGSLTGKSATVSGATDREVQMGQETVPSLGIGRVDFQNTFALHSDLAGLKESFQNFGGILGQPIISKANWLINYPNQTLTLGSGHLADSTYLPIPIKQRGGAPYTFIQVDGRRQRVIIDLGSSSELNLPEDSQLARQLLAKYESQTNTRERYTIGGLQIVTEKIITVPLITLSGIEFHNVRTTINVSSQPRIGIALFHDCGIYIDSQEGSYQISPQLSR